MAICNCDKCDNDGANSISKATGLAYCRRCGHRIKSIFEGLVEIEIKPDDKRGLLDHVISDAIFGHELVEGDD